MNLIRSLMGRRQFLITAGVGSTAALAYRKVAVIDTPVFQPGVAMADEKSGTAGVKGASDRYSNLLSPLQIGNVILKNRIYSTDSFPPGLEASLSDKGVSHYIINRARNGAAIVTFSGTGKHRINATDNAAQIQLLQLTEGVHFHGARILASFIDCEPSGYNIGNLDADTSGGKPRAEKYRPIMGGTATKAIPIDKIQKMTDDFVAKAKLFKSLGFDGIHLYMSYRSSILACSLSPAVNNRTDRYGGSIENRVRLTLDLCRAIKWVCGQDFLVEAQVSGEEEAGGYTLEDLCKYAKFWEGSIDILQLRGWDGASSHPTGYNSVKGRPMTLRFAEAIKKSGAKIVVAPNGGYHDPDLCEEYIASGKADMIAMARSFICDPEYGQKAYEGRGEDVVPCILCNKCHGPTQSGPDPTMCSVNPKLGLEDKLDRMIAAPSVSRKVAVIGGGPAGMKAALVAVERGHKVTLYEKNDFLGGQLKHADYASFQWPLKDYKDYLVLQVKKAGVEVLLSTRATPEMVKAKNYDAVMVASGAEYVVPDIPGVKGSNVFTPLFVYGNKTLGKNIVIIGGDLIGAQTGIYLAENGHRVTILSSVSTLAPDAPAIHYKTNLEMKYEALSNFSFITEATATGISEGKVTYFDAMGEEKSVQADSVVISIGRKPRMDEAMKFAGAAGRFFVIGDCYAAGSVQTCNRMAFAAASRI
jgi:2,4-dienoyl-CoA reductase-like NADH-dependent reductase (Old Yellow Enzyme family)/thioredoxin reductase